MSEQVEATSRVYLRPLEESDINADYAGWFADGTVTHFLDSRGISISDAVDYLRHGLETREYFMQAIIDRETSRHIGNVKLGPINWAHMFSDLVTVIGDRSFWGKGYATDAIREGTLLAFRKYNIRKLSGGIARGNVGSLKAYTRAGWVVEGIMVGHHLIDGKAEDRIVVSAFNPDFFGPDLPKGIADV
jgi:ribosomal-protein-alanine N-acetyltransferase